jgi:hypothetical protein
MTADDIEFEPDDIQALGEWLRGVKQLPPRELQARRTLARMLRYAKPLNLGLRWVLADAVDPDGEGVHRLILKRKPGQQRKISDQAVAVFVHRKRQSGEKFRLAVEQAMTEFNVSHGKVTSAYKKWRPHIERNPELFERDSR